MGLVHQALFGSLSSVRFDSVRLEYLLLNWCLIGFSPNESFCWDIRSAEYKFKTHFVNDQLMVHRKETLPRLGHRQHFGCERFVIPGGGARLKRKVAG